MNWIERIFGKKEKTSAEVAFDELPVWLESRADKLGEELSRHTASVYSDIADALGELKESTSELERAEPEGKFHLKMVKMATSNRDNMVKQVRTLVENLDVPKAADAGATVEFHDRAMQTLNMCLENMMKSYQYTKQVFLDESKQVIADVNRLRRLLDQLVEPISERQNLLDAIENARAAMQAVKDLSSAAEAEKSSINEKEEKTALTREELERKQKALVQLRGSPAWKQYLGYLDELAALEGNAEKIESEINGMVLPLNKALNRLKQLSESGRYTLAPNIREGLYLCLSDPKSVSSEFFVEFRRIIESDVLKLEKLDKVLEQLRYVESSFDVSKKQYQSTVLKIEEKKGEISKLEAVAEEKNLSDSIAALQDRLASTEKELDVSKRHLASLEEGIGLKKQELQQSVSDIDSRVTVLL